jgi:probable rRNA maturation factor
VDVDVYVQDQSLTKLISQEQWAEWFKRWLMCLEPGFSPIDHYELSLRLTNDAEIQIFNAQYRQFDQPTDVLAFAALEVQVPQPLELLNHEPLDLGDIVISTETAQRQAIQGKHSLLQELAWLATHGLLHLLGWDHPDEASLVEMLQQQTVLMNVIEVPVPSWETLGIQGAVV